MISHHLLPNLDMESIAKALAAVACGIILGLMFGLLIAAVRWL